MDCPHCGEETDPGKTCGKCGATLPPRKEVEVEYKEFRISELLDIRMAGKAGAQGVKNEKAEKPGRKETKAAKASAMEAKRDRKTSPILIITAIVLVLAAIAGFYLAGFL